MTLDVRLFPCLSDNYGFLARDRATGRVAAIDAPDAEAVSADLAASGWSRLDLLLITHWHPDHTQGAARLRAETGCEIVGPAEVERVVPLDRRVAEGDAVDVGETRFEVVETPGHTLGHVVYRAVEAGQAFVGDTLFVLGCGRLFEGTPEQMWKSLSRLAAWPEETVVWCAHEYAAANARFAASVDAGAATAARIAEIDRLRADGRPSVPTTIGAETGTNPFLKAGDAARFAELRAAKDAFAG